MVELKQAVAVATDFAKQHLDSERAADIRLEEIESSDAEGKHLWLITLSNSARKTDLQKMLQPSLLGVDTSREYRTFAIAKLTGEIDSMKIRIFPGP